MVVEVGGGADDGAGAGFSFAAFLGAHKGAVGEAADFEAGGAIFHEDAGADEDGLGTQLHHERGIGGGRDAAGGKVRERGGGRSSATCSGLNS